jgi:hypothetical protein
MPMIWCWAFSMKTTLAVFSMRCERGCGFIYGRKMGGHFVGASARMEGASHSINGRRTEGMAESRSYECSRTDQPFARPF